MPSLVFAAALVFAPAFLTAAPAAISVSTTRSDTTQWRIDRTHSELVFRVRHLVSRVSGTFKDWDGTIVAERPDWQGGAVSVTVRTASIDTNNDRRDVHLRSPDFFDSDHFPEMTFRSTSVTLEGRHLTMEGELTIRGVTHPVVLTGSFLGVVPGPEGHDRAGFEAATRINRLDYGVTWNRTAEGGGMLLGDEVSIEVTVEAVRQ